MKNGASPSFNWINFFNEFYEIVSVLQVELKINVSISDNIIKHSIKNAVIRNLQCISSHEFGGVIYNYMGFLKIHLRLLQVYENIDENIKAIPDTIKFSNDDLSNAKYFYLFWKTGIDNMNTFTFDDAVSRGSFIEYTKHDQHFTCSKLHYALIDISYEITSLKKYALEVTREDKNEFWCALNCSYPIVDLNFDTISKYNSIYERFLNIYNLSKYIILSIEKCNNNLLPYPKIVKGVVPDPRPTEKEILDDLLKV